ncbi:MAG TPA: hypothetical protein VHB79_10635 [Polyangiaceae bacterium]|nr:hypothetical protein [Polyangiaceae bacterium]
MATQVTCPGCKGALSAAQFLAACQTWFADVDCVSYVCLHCQQPGEAQLETGRIVHGFIYAAGRPYFSPQRAEPLPNLTVARVDGGLQVTFEATTRIVPRT